MTVEDIEIKKTTNNTIITAEFLDVVEPEPEPEPEPPRDIDVLLGLPYSEMTEEEISIVINYKAEQIAKEDVYQQQILEIEKGMAEQVKVYKETADYSQNLLDILTKQAMDIYEKASNNGQTE